MYYSTLVSILKKNKTKSIFLRSFLIVFLTCICIFVMIAVYDFNFNVKMIKDEIDYRVAESQNKIAEDIDVLFGKINNIFIHAEVSNDFNLFLMNDANNQMKRESMIAINKELGDFVNNSDVIDSVYLYGMKTNYVISTNSQNNSNKFDVFGEKEFILSILNTEKDIFTREAKRGIRYISCVKKLTIDSNIYGYLIVNINFDKFLDMCLYDSSQDHVVMTDENDTVILTNTDDIEIGVKNSVLDNKKYVFEELELNNTLCGFFYSSHYKQLYYQQLKMMIVRFVLLAIIFIIISLVVSFVLIRIYYNALLSIISIIEENGALYDGSETEIQYIRNNIVNMVNNYKKVEEQLSENIIKLQQNEILSLQSQLNPHFLFNSLNLISTFDLGFNKKEHSIGEAITLLSDILRMSMDNTSIFSNIESEVIYAKKYVRFQNLRYNNPINVIWNIESDTKNKKTPKFFLQPLIENAIQYGIKKTEREGIIKVTTLIKDDNMYIEVKDNGAGMDKNTLEQLYDELKIISVKRKKHIGLSNINSRIKLMFGEEYNIELTSDEDGTTVKIILPVIEDI